MAECVDYSFKLLGKREIRSYKGKKNWEPYVMELFAVYGFFSVFFTKILQWKIFIKARNTRKRNNRILDDRGK